MRGASIEVQTSIVKLWSILDVGKIATSLLAADLVDHPYEVERVDC